MKTQLFFGTTSFGIATLAAAIADGCWPEARRVLVVSNNATVPEATVGPDSTPGIDGLLGVFDDIYDYNATIAPQHPTEWRPPTTEWPMLQRLLAGQWGLDPSDLTLVVESIQAAPSLIVSQLFPEARIDVYADGLMSYGPTRVGLPTQVGARIDRVLHLDLVPEVTPLLLREYHATPVIISSDRFREVVSGLDVTVPTMITDAEPGTVAVLLGQYFAAANILTQDEEDQLHRDLVRGAVAAGHTKLVFKPHPSAPQQHADPLIDYAGELGAELIVHDEAELVETWFAEPGIGLVAGCFSTALLTASACYQLPAARSGTELLLERVRPYENSNRIPVTLAHSVLPDLRDLDQSMAAPVTEPAAAPVPIDELVQLVGYCMQASRNPDLRNTAERLLTEHWDEVRGYVKRRRLTILDLPGRLPVKPKVPTPKKRPKWRPRRALGRAAKRLLGARLSRVVRERRGAMSRMLRPQSG